jgi:hypothetical protein
MFVSADHDPVVGAVDQVAVQGRVGGDGVAAAHVACQRLTGADNAESSHHQPTRGLSPWKPTAFGDGRAATFRASRDGPIPSVHRALL